PRFENEPPFENDCLSSTLSYTASILSIFLAKLYVEYVQEGAFMPGASVFREISSRFAELSTAVKFPSGIILKLSFLFHSTVRSGFHPAPRLFAGHSKAPLSVPAILCSLRPENLKSSDFVDLAGMVKASVRFDPAQPQLRLSYDWSVAGGHIPFPQHACGYLYYHPPPLHAPLAGSIRLRVNSDDARGSDLLLPTGLPWCIGLPQLVAFAHGAGALQQLLADDLISHAAITHCTRVFAGRRSRLPHVLLFALDQPFALAMEQAELRLVVVGRERVALFTKQRLFGDPAPRYPFKGMSSLCKGEGQRAH
ncbi:hypothetical protein B0H17DRAFT_1247076, partial [Mycena rosella]